VDWVSRCLEQVHKLSHSLDSDIWSVWDPLCGFRVGWRLDTGGRGARKWKTWIY